MTRIDGWASTLTLFRAAAQGGTTGLATPGGFYDYGASWGLQSRPGTPFPHSTATAAHTGSAASGAEPLRGAWDLSDLEERFAALDWGGRDTGLVPGHGPPLGYRNSASHPAPSTDCLTQTLLVTTGIAAQPEQVKLGRMALTPLSSGARRSRLEQAEPQAG